ncbi:MAG: hypothetical protein KatS3mg124_2227 [Porticoccaceae bacterium]|nr:MAG: hypothetical protein KatS3mg124_2227 [Porticoccaceae bacterium]
MDPFAHSFVGGALAAAGLKRATPLATAALLLGANAPDVDILTAFAGDYLALAHRRGLTHGPLAWLVLPVLLTGLLLLWDRGVRRRLRPHLPPARGGPLWALSTLAVLTHPALDWLNNYGVRLLAPFDWRWFYGDALFIVDPWLWLAAGGACTLHWARGRAACLGWLGFWSAASLLVLATPLAPWPAKLLWCAGLAGLACLAARGAGRGPQPARCALLFAALWGAGNAAASAAAEARVATAVGVPAARVMVAPVPANPFRGAVVIDADAFYRLGEWHWLGAPRFRPGARLAKGLDHPAVVAASRHPWAVRFLTWSRFPLARVTADGTGFVVAFADARYPPQRAGLRGPVLRVAGGRVEPAP